MKVVIINFFGITPDMPGATKHYDMAVHFSKKKDVSVEFWMSGINYFTDNFVDGIGLKNYYEKEDENGIKLVYIKNIKHRNKKILRELGMLLFSFLSAMRILISKDIDIIILSMPPVTPFAAISSYLKKIPLIADVEDLWPLFLEESGIKNKFILKYYECQANLIYKLSNGIEAVSNGMLNYIKQNINFSNKDYWLSPLGVTLSEYDKIFENNKIYNYEWKDDFKIMYIGAHGLANDIISVLHTIKEIEMKEILVNDKKLSFIFIGDGNYKEEIIREKNKLGLKNVYFEKSVSSNLVPFFLSQADVCLTNLRRLECFKLVRPNKIFQYMAASKAIICGIWGEASDIIQEANSGINVDFTNYTQASNQIIEFITKTDLKKVGESGKKYIKKNGDRTIIFDDFFCHMKNILNKK